jgi:hypothetical protein
MENKFAITPPSKTFAKNFIKPFKLYFDPQFIGIDELDVSQAGIVCDQPLGNGCVRRLSFRH